MVTNRNSGGLAPRIRILVGRHTPGQEKVDRFWYKRRTSWRQVACGGKIHFFILSSAACLGNGATYPIDHFLVHYFHYLVIAANVLRMFSTYCSCVRAKADKNVNIRVKVLSFVEVANVLQKENCPI